MFGNKLLGLTVEPDLGTLNTMMLGVLEELPDSN